MTTTVQQLIEKLQGFPDNSVIVIKAAADEQQFLITDFNLEDNFLNIILSSQEEEEEE
ncbi:hypothetical protein NIES25_05750 [Nostoc linckia NIES-25]|nr:hypothetical protein NIES25_05750 [Nostoc linckia NIES-25]